jgi:hypothetical protein
MKRTRSFAASVAGALALASCRAATPPVPPPRFVAAPPPVSPSPSAAEPDVDCSSRDGQLAIEDPHQGVAHVRRFREGDSFVTGGDVSIAIVNCTGEDVVAWTLHAKRARGDALGLEGIDASARIASRAKRILTMPLPIGKSVIVAKATGTSGVERSSETVVVRVVDDAFEEAQTKCDACGGTLAPRGIGSRLLCNCKTRDGGQPCVDGLECESACLATGDVEIVDHNGPHGAPRGFRVGKCSATTLNFGCLPRIAEGASVGGPLPLPLPRMGPVCAD